MNNFIDHTLDEEGKVINCIFDLLANTMEMALPDTNFALLIYDENNFDSVSLVSKSKPANIVFALNSLSYFIRENMSENLYEIIEGEK